MSAVFLKVLNMSIAAGWLILTVILLRLLLKKAPKWISCILWAVVAVRLICPFSIESMWSLIPSAETVSLNIMYAAEPEIHSGVNSLNRVVNPIITKAFEPNPLASANPLQIWIPVAACVWILGIVVLLAYAGISYIRLHRKVGASIPLGGKVWIGDEVQTPFILGIIRPKIYLPSDMKEMQMQYVIAHEQAHLKRHDHWWKPLGFLLLAIYWFNPLIWVAYILLCRDIELACDERVVMEMDLEDKKAYSKALLSCSIPYRMSAVCPLSFGEVAVKKRVKNVLNYKQPAFWVVAVAVVVCVIVAVCFLTNPKGKRPYAEEPFGHNYRVTEIVYDAPQFSFAYMVDTAPQICLTADYQLIALGGISDWAANVGMQEMPLTIDNFDRYIEANGEGGMYNISMETLREENERAWCGRIPVDNGDSEFYYVLKQQNGDVYIVYGYEGEEGGRIRWIFAMADLGTNKVPTL